MASVRLAGGVRSFASETISPDLMFQSVTTSAIATGPTRNEADATSDAIWFRVQFIAALPSADQIGSIP
jgi:hypothetical protein